MTFTAAVYGSADPRVQWEISASTGGIDADGRCTAPSTEGDYEVVATSLADPDARATARVRVRQAFSQAPGTVAYGYDPTRGATDDPAAAPNGGTARYVVPSGGVSSGSCTLGAPCAMAHALDVVTAGDTIYMRGGTYTSPVSVTVSGTSSQPIEIRSYPGEWAVFDLDGVDVSSQVCAMRSLNNSHVIFRNFEIENANTGSSIVHGFIAWNASDITVENVYSHHNAGTGLRIYRSSNGASNVTFANCTSAFNYDPDDAGDNADGFETESGNGNVYRRCVAYRNSDDGFDTNYSNENTYIDCVAVQNGYLSDGATHPSGGDGNGFKAGWPGYGGNVFQRCIASGNWMSGFGDEEGHDLTFQNVIVHDQSLGFRLLNSGHTIINAAHVESGSDNLSGQDVTTSLGGSFGGSVGNDAFESVDFSDLNSTAPGSRYFYPVSSSLIDQGTDVDLPYSGAAADIGAREAAP